MPPKQLRRDLSTVLRQLATTQAGLKPLPAPAPAETRSAGNEEVCATLVASPL